MKVMLVSPSGVPGGAERALAGLARGLPEYGIEPVAVLLQDGPLRSWLTDVGCPVTVIDAGRTRQLGRTALTVRRLAAIARGADVVISNQSKGHVYGGAAARLAGRPAVWWQQGTPERSRIEMTAAVIPSAAVVCSGRDAERAQQRITPRRRIDVIHLGIEVDAVAGRAGSGAAIRRALGWQDNPVVGIVGRLQPWKGQETFLRAAAQVAATHPEVGFAVVGGAVLGWEGDYPDQLRRLAEDLGIGDRVHFAGHQSDVYPWFDAMDVVVHASHGEPFGLVLVEAMALGKPLVATAAGGPLEIVEDGVSGLLVPPGDVQSLAVAVGRILADDELSQSLAVSARKRADLFSSERMAESFAGLLISLESTKSKVQYELEDKPRPALVVDNPEYHEDAMAGLNTHAIVDELIEPALQRPILDVGAGQGAFTARLVGRGERVIALGIAPTQFRADSPFVICDMDRGIPIRSSTVSGIVAIEVIEHLENGYQLLREAARCLVQNGWLILTTPNVLSFSSRLSMLFRGYPIYFGPREYETNGHIHPISLLDIQRMAVRSGLVLETVTYNVGKLPIPRIRHRYPLRRQSCRNMWLGQSLIVKLRKVSEPDRGFARG